MTTFTNNTIPEENTHYTCISAIDIDSVLKIDKKSFPQAYLEQCNECLDHLEIIDYDTENDSDSDSIDYDEIKRRNLKSYNIFIKF